MPAINQTLSKLNTAVLVYDGSKGVMLQLQGLQSGESAELWNLTHPEAVEALYRAYIDAGADILQTNTFCGNRVALERHGLTDKLYDINYAGVALAKKAAGGKVPVAASIGPTGLITQPAGTLSFEDAYGIFLEQIRPLADAGADFLHFETFGDLSELRAALVAAQGYNIPVFATVTVDNGPRTLYGNPASVCALAAERLGAVMTGVNCSGGAESILGAIQQMQGAVSLPLIAKPNAGLPEMINGKLTYSQTPEEFASYAQALVNSGVRLAGGCCGTGPEYIRALREKLGAIAIPPFAPEPKDAYIASAYAQFNLAAFENGSPGVERLALTGDPYDAIDEASDAEADCLLLDFSAAGELDMQDFAANFSLSVRTPVILTGDAAAAESISGFLRYYVGVAGITPGAAETLNAANLPVYGAQAVNATGC
jgi:5-methyltetrahydrofolate--homocysteine methyltransferase